MHLRLQKQHRSPGRRLHFKGRRGAGNGWPTQPRSKAQAGVIIQRKANSRSQESQERWWSEQSVLDSTAWVNAPGGQESPLQSHPGATTLLPTPSPCHQGVPGECQAVPSRIGCCLPSPAPTQPGRGLQGRTAPGTCPEPWGCSGCSSSQHPSEDPGRDLSAQPQLPGASTASRRCPWGWGNAVECPPCF